MQVAIQPVTQDLPSFDISPVILTCVSFARVTVLRVAPRLTSTYPHPPSTVPVSDVCVTSFRVDDVSAK